MFSYVTAPETAGRFCFGRLHLPKVLCIIYLFGQSQNRALFGIRMRALRDEAP